MTNRQKEFVRHYLLGKPAREAAIAAGYTVSTAERNAAEMLSHPAIAARIQRLRAQTVFTRQDLATAKAELDHIIKYTQDERLKLNAMDKLARLARLELILPHLEREENTGENPKKQDKKGTQTTDNQLQKTTEEIPGPPEHDTLPDGTPAYDLRLAAQKPKPPKPDPVEIILVDKLPQ